VRIASSDNICTFWTTPESAVAHPTGAEKLFFVKKVEQTASYAQHTDCGMRGTLRYAHNIIPHTRMQAGE